MNEVELTPVGSSKLTEASGILPLASKNSLKKKSNKDKNAESSIVQVGSPTSRLVDKVKTGALSSDEQKKKMEFLFLSERGNQETISANKIVNVSTLESNPRNNLVRKLSNIEAAAEKLKNIKLKVCISEIREKLTSLMQSTNQKIIASVTTIISMFIENVTNLLNNNSNPEKNLEQINKEAVATLQALQKLEKM